MATILTLIGLAHIAEMFFRSVCGGADVEREAGRDYG